MSLILFSMYFNNKDFYANRAISKITTLKIKLMCFTMTILFPEPFHINICTVYVYRAIPTMIIMHMKLFLNYNYIAYWSISTIYLLLVHDIHMCTLYCTPVLHIEFLTLVKVSGHSAMCIEF